MNASTIIQLHPRSRFAVGDLVEITKGNHIDKRAIVQEVADDATVRVAGFGWYTADSLELVERVKETTVDGATAQIAFDGQTGAPQEPTLIELPIEDLTRQWADQYDEWMAADQEAKAARQHTKVLRKKLDATGTELRRRIAGGLVQPPLLSGVAETRTVTVR